MSHPQKYAGTFQYAGKDIAFNFWLLPKDSSPPDTVVFLGAGQVGVVPRWVAQAASTGVVVVDGLPHWEAHPSGEDTAKFSLTYVQAAFEIVLRTFGAQSMNVIAESQAAPAGVILTCNTPDRVHNLALIRPLGFTAQSFGESEQARLKTFRRRILQTSRQLMYDPRSVAIALVMLRAMLREPNFAAFNKKYAVGISYDLLEDCRQAIEIQRRKGHSFTLLLGEKDRMFPPKEVRAALNGVGIAGVVIEVLPGVGHSSLAVRSSRTILRRAIEIVRA